MMRMYGEKRRKRVAAIAVLAAACLLAGCQAEAGTDPAGSGSAALTASGMPASGSPTAGAPSAGGSADGNAQTAGAGGTAIDGAAGSEAGNANGEAGSETLRLQLDGVSGIRLTDGQEGWVWGMSGANMSMLRTTDGGRHWRSVSAEDGWPAAGGNVEGPNLFWPDARGRGAIVSWTDEEGLHLSRSEDGGSSWKASLVPHQDAIAGIQLQEGGLGWMLTEGGPAMGHTLKKVYRTTDGGKTWSVVSSDDGYIPNPDATPNALPQYGLATGLSFADGKRGWAAIDNPIGTDILLYRTTDSGRAWQLAGLKPPADLDAKAYSIPEAPRWFDAAGKSGALTVVFKEADRARLLRYETTDGGAAWDSQELFRGEKLERDEPVALAFASFKDGVAFQGGKLRTTRDGGRTWQAAEADETLRKTLERTPAVRQLAFADARTGWLLAETERADGWTLLGTEDGGRSWREVAAGGAS